MQTSSPYSSQDLTLVVGHLLSPSEWRFFSFLVVPCASDAAGSVGCGAIWSPHWLQMKWSDTGTQPACSGGAEEITFQELLLIVLACAVWGERWHDSSVQVCCNNMATVSIVNSGCSKVEAMMHLIRCLFFIRAKFNLYLEAVHIRGAHNQLMQFPGITWPFSIPRFRQQRPIPPQLASLLAIHPVDWTSPDWSQRFGSCFQQV